MNRYYLRAVLVAVATVVFLLFGAGALGIIGDGGRPDRMYLAVIAVGLVGAAISRLRARGMAWTMAAMAVAQVVVPVVAIATGQAEGASLVDLAGLTLMYAGLFALAGWLFWRADGAGAGHGGSAYVPGGSSTPAR